MKINVKGIEVFAYHGVYEHERKHGQKFVIDVELDLGEYACDDSADKTADYDLVVKTVEEWAVYNTFNLIESVAEGAAEKILYQFPTVRKAKVTVHKPDAPVEFKAQDISATAEKAWHTVFLGLGSNLGDRQGYLDGAVAALKERPDVRVLSVSDSIDTPPYGVVDQPDFLNCCIKIETVLSPLKLLSLCQELENAAHRVRTRPWGERTLDVDILLYGDRIIDTPSLTVPHPDMHNRAFVLEPLCEIAAGTVHPVLQKTVKMLKEALRGNGITLL